MKMVLIHLLYGLYISFVVQRQLMHQLCNLSFDGRIEFCTSSIASHFIQEMLSLINLTHQLVHHTHLLLLLAWLLRSVQLLLLFLLLTLLFLTLNLFTHCCQSTHPLLQVTLLFFSTRHFQPFPLFCHRFPVSCYCCYRCHTLLLTALSTGRIQQLTLPLLSVVVRPLPYRVGLCTVAR